MGGEGGNRMSAAAIAGRRVEGVQHVTCSGIMKGCGVCRGDESCGGRVVRVDVLRWVGGGQGGVGGVHEALSRHFICDFSLRGRGEGGGGGVSRARGRGQGGGGGEVGMSLRRLMSEGGGGAIRCWYGCVGKTWWLCMSSSLTTTITQGT